MSRSTLFIVVGLTLVGAIFRLYGLHDRGVIAADTASYVMESRLWLAGLKLLALRFGFSHAESTQDVLRYISLHAHSFGSGKAAHDFFRAVAMYLTDDSIGSSHLAVAVFGILTIPVLFLLVRRLFQDERLALTAAALLAISPGHVAYSRGFKSEADCMFFFILGIWCLYEGAIRRNEPHSVRWTWGAGILIGIGYACSNRTVFILPCCLAIIIVSEALHWKRSWWSVALLYARFLCGFAAVLVFWELPYHVAMLACKSAGIGDQWFSTCWESILGRFVYGVSDWRLVSFPVFLYQIAVREGIGLGLMIAGAVVLWRKREQRFAASIVTLVIGAGFMMFWYTPYKAPVFFSYSWPYFCLLGALGWWAVYEWLSAPRRLLWRMPVSALLLASVVGLDLWSDWEQTQITSHLPEAVRWLQANRPDGVVLCSGYEHALCVYDNKHVAPLPVPVSLEYLRNAYQSGARLILTDPQKFNAVLTCLGHVMGPDYPIDRPLLPNALAFATPSIAAIEMSTRPLVAITNGCNRSFFLQFATEHNVHLEKTRLFMQSVDAVRDGAIRIYDLAEVLRNLEALRLRSNPTSPVFQGNW